MATNDDREGAPAGQQKSAKPARAVRPPVIEPGGIYAGQDLIHNFKFDPVELRRLNHLPEGGLYPLDTGTREEFYAADDVIQFYLNRPRKKKQPKPATPNK